MDKIRKSLERPLLLGIIFLVVGHQLALLPGYIWGRDPIGFCQLSGLVLLIWANTFFMKIIAVLIYHAILIRILLNLTAFILRYGSLFGAVGIAGYAILRKYDIGRDVTQVIRFLLQDHHIGHLPLHEIATITAPIFLVLAIILFFHVDPDWVKPE